MHLLVNIACALFCAHTTKSVTYFVSLSYVLPSSLISSQWSGQLVGLMFLCQICLSSVVSLYVNMYYSEHGVCAVGVVLGLCLWWCEAIPVMCHRPYLMYRSAALLLASGELAC